ncbi:MAG TPA: DUF1648 domain-containing protein [Terriglobales bacterium]|jgi:hypothetical protein|nr:DUF1648 domain-containing protein [Terriglobales bacterium]
MNRKLWPWLLALPWIALPATALRYWLVLEQLPARMATHFNAAGQANGWMSREASLGFALGLTAFILVIFTVITYVIHRKYATDASSWAMLGFFYLLVGVIYYVNGSVVEHNLGGGPVGVGPVLIVVPLAVVALTMIFLASRRGAALPAAAVLAEEVHAVRLWTLVFVVPLAAELAVLAAVPTAAVRLGTLLLCLLFAALAGMTWSGFQYRFSPAGVEIRTLGLRLRSIPADEIRSYEAGKWSAWRGYGIRGIGSCRAYVWGNRGVRIRTTSGEVFLGHSEPERILRDLDAIKQFAR